MTNNPKLRDKHREQYSDLEWVRNQPEGPPNYKIGDVVEFCEGGYGVICEVSQPHDGWPSSYATSDIDGHSTHPRKKRAWHYEGDFKKLVGKSPLHFFKN